MIWLAVLFFAAALLLAGYVVIVGNAVARKFDPPVDAAGERV